ncbi:MAG: 4-hydroxy-tetrahydrodipicolinate synthase [Deltaproteobacteria bacterium]|nr:4-hydroxy-tetrahydrodipicolinate synthase [Deltaproteobacteria bacterium]
MLLRGSLVAIVTPFDGEEVAGGTLARLIERQLDAGTHGVVVCGTTGEAPTLAAGEVAAAVSLARQVIRGRVPLLVGTGTNVTRSTVERTRQAYALGADAALVVTPYYNKPTAAGLFAHYGTVAREGGLPLVAYTVPGRTGAKPSTATLLSLCRIPGVVGLKEASGDLVLATQLAAELGEGFALLCGEDALALPFWAVGGQGTVSVTANVDPARCSRMWEAFAAEDLPRARQLNRELFALHQALFWESNPIPVKEALHQLGLCSPELRLPLTRMSPELRPKLGELLRELGLP